MIFQNYGYFKHATIKTMLQNISTPGTQNPFDTGAYLLNEVKTCYVDRFQCHHCLVLWLRCIQEICVPPLVSLYFGMASECRCVFFKRLETRVH